MQNSVKKVRENMFTAFSSDDADRFVATVSEDNAWIYHGTQIISKGLFKKRKSASKIKRSARELKQDWIQIYTVENDLIPKMEEFATSEEVKK